MILDLPPYSIKHLALHAESGVELRIQSEDELISLEVPTL